VLSLASGGLRERSFASILALTHAQLSLTAISLKRCGLEPNTISPVNLAGQTGAANTSVYSATKAALRSIARTAAAELVDRRIRVNVVAPGPIETPILGRMGLPKEAVDQIAKTLIAQVPMKRFGTAEEVAGAVAFLASGDASYITGVEINVDGGFGQV
jgi:NAD(P)-dependent dehydrogenase (short-subunit alcohol dehydrogenase family)